MYMNDNSIVIKTSDYVDFIHAYLGFSMILLCLLLQVLQANKQTRNGNAAPIKEGDEKGSKACTLM